MSSRALKALQQSLGAGGGARKPDRQAPSTPAAASAPEKRKRSQLEREEVVRESPSPVDTRGRPSGALPADFALLLAHYEKICFIFGIHANRERRTLHDLQQAFHQLCGREVGLDDLRRLRAAHPGCLSFGYRGLHSKPLRHDLTVQIPKENGAPCFEKHKRALRGKLTRLAREGRSLPPLSDLPDRPSNRSMEESERFVKKVIQSYSPQRKGARPGAGSSSTIKAFFQTNKLVSSGALDAVERTHNKTRRLFDEEELEARRKRRNLSQLPALFDRLRGLFRSLNRRAMPLKDVVPSLMSTRKDKSTQQSEIEDQLCLLVDSAPEWCAVRADTRGNRILSLSAGSDVNAVRRKLNLLSQDSP